MGYQLNDKATSQARIAEVIRLRRSYIHWSQTRIGQEVGLTNAYVGQILAKAGLVTAEDVLRTMPTHSVHYAHIDPSRLK